MDLLILHLLYYIQPFICIIDNNHNNNHNDNDNGNDNRNDNEEVAQKFYK